MTDINDIQSEASGEERDTSCYLGCYGTIDVETVKTDFYLMGKLSR